MTRGTGDMERKKRLQADAETERRGNPLCPAGAQDNRFPDPHAKIFRNPDTGREAMYIYAGHDEGIDRFVLRD